MSDAEKSLGKILIDTWAWVAYAALPPAALDEAERRWGCSAPLLERYAEDNEAYVRMALERFAAINQEYMESLISVGVSGFFPCLQLGRSGAAEPVSRGCKGYDR